MPQAQAGARMCAAVCCAVLRTQSRGDAKAPRPRCTSAAWSHRKTAQRPCAARPTPAYFQAVLLGVELRLQVFVTFLDGGVDVILGDEGRGGDEAPGAVVLVDQHHRGRRDLRGITCEGKRSTVASRPFDSSLLHGTSTTRAARYQWQQRRGVSVGVGVA